MEKSSPWASKSFNCREKTEPASISYLPHKGLNSSFYLKFLRSILLPEHLRHSTEVVSGRVCCSTRSPQLHSYLSYRGLKRSRRIICSLLLLLCHNSSLSSLLSLPSRTPLTPPFFSLALFGNRPAVSNDQVDSTGKLLHLSSSSAYVLLHLRLVAYLSLSFQPVQQDLFFSASGCESGDLLIHILFCSSQATCISPVHVQHAVFHSTWSVKALLFSKVHLKA